MNIRATKKECMLDLLIDLEKPRMDLPYKMTHDIASAAEDPSRPYLQSEYQIALQRLENFQAFREQSRARRQAHLDKLYDRQMAQLKSIVAPPALDVENEFVE